MKENSLTIITETIAWRAKIMDSTKLKEMLIAEKNEQQEYIDRFYKRMYELEEMIWKIERLEKEEAEKQAEVRA